MATFFGFDKPLILLITALEAVVWLTGLAAFWWFGGRDDWLGDNPVSVDGRERIKPLFAHETIVPEYGPPTVPDKQRPLRPAEIGVLLRERVDDVDISATLIDLAIRGHLRIEEGDGDWSSRPHKADYRLVRLNRDVDGLLDYEHDLLRAIFESKLAKPPHDGESQPYVLLSQLAETFWIDMGNLKRSLTRDIVTVNEFFAGDPEQARTSASRALAPALTLISVGAFFALGVHDGLALLAVPPLFGFIALEVIGRAMPRRTGLGREMLRRTLGFRLFLLAAELDEIKLKEQDGHLHEYLPYAMVMHCSSEWSQRLSRLDSIGHMLPWYKSTLPIDRTMLEAHMQTFSAGVASSMAKPAGVASR